MSSAESPVFHDPEGRRWRRVKRTYLFLAVVVTALAAVFIASVLANPALPTFNLRQLSSLPRVADLKPKAPNIPANPSEQKAKKAQAELQRELAKIKQIVPGKRRFSSKLANAVFGLGHAPFDRYLRARVDPLRAFRSACSVASVAICRYAERAWTKCSAASRVARRGL